MKRFFIGLGIGFAASWVVIFLMIMIGSRMETPSVEFQYMELKSIPEYETYRNINVWEKTSVNGKFPKVGSVPAGSTIKVVGEEGEDYRVLLSNGIVGWINKMHFVEDETSSSRRDVF